MHEDICLKKLLQVCKIHVQPVLMQNARTVQLHEFVVTACSMQLCVKFLCVRCLQGASLIDS